MFWTDKLSFFQGIIELVRFIISHEKVRSKRLKIQHRLIQNSSNIGYFGPRFGQVIYNNKLYVCFRQRNLPNISNVFPATSSLY